MFIGNIDFCINTINIVGYVNVRKSQESQVTSLKGSFDPSAF